MLLLHLVGSLLCLFHFVSASFGLILCCYFNRTLWPAHLPLFSTISTVFVFWLWVKISNGIECFFGCFQLCSINSPLLFSVSVLVFRQDALSTIYFLEKQATHISGRFPFQINAVFNLKIMTVSTYDLSMSVKTTVDSPSRDVFWIITKYNTTPLRYTRELNHEQDTNEFLYNIDTEHSGMWHRKLDYK